MGTYHEGWPQRSNTPTFGARLRADKSERHSQSSESVHRSYLNHPVQYNYRNYGHGTLDKNSKYNLWPRFHMNTRNSFDSINRMPLPKNMENIFRSSSMKASVSSSPWKPSGAVTARDV
ncbi:unnamed protein product [Didymodactylos carnosus]|nr:unnamed protein product [Didymodactylos carnosus]CAF4262883.1 unnamed protein product [Didymodactylos carnosus]